MPSVSFFAGESNNINNLAGSGIGFYGASFAYSVPVGEWQQTTFITNSAGTIQGPQADNIKYSNMGSGFVNSATVATGLRYIPNQNATLEIRVTDTTMIRVQNATVKLYDRASITNRPTGVTTAVAELVHPDPTQTVLGSGNSTWTIFSGVAGTIQSLSLSNSPGISGQYGGQYGVNLGGSGLSHSWYLALSASPDSIGSKNQYALLFSYEYS
jgi:hypothetical protein